LIKSGTKIFRVDSDSIFYIEKDGNYSVYYLTDQKIIARESVSEILENLPLNFLQIHKSFIVNKNRVTSLEKESLMVNEKMLPIGASFKENAFQVLLEN